MGRETHPHLNPPLEGEENIISETFEKWLRRSSKIFFASPWFARNCD